MKYDIFISYSRKDKEIVNKFASGLKKNRYEIWMDIDGIESGDAFKEKIVNTIRNSSLVSFLLLQSLERIRVDGKRGKCCS